MLDKWLIAKVGDFGLSRAHGNANTYNIAEFDEDGSKRKLVYAWKWIAPEIVTQRTFSQASDVWAFGITLWEIFTFGEVPYPSKNNLCIFLQCFPLCLLNI